MPHQTKKKRKYVILGPWHFEINIRRTLGCISTIIILAYLGTWQVNRALQKEYLIQQLQEKSTGMPLNLATLDNPILEKFRFTPIVMYGTYLNNFTFLLDNQVYQHKVGYRILTAFTSPYLNKMVLVDRGWIVQGVSRQQLPEIKDAYGVKEVQGFINTIPSGITLHPDTYNPLATWPIVIQSLDFAFIAENLQHPVYNFVIQLYQNDPTAYTVPPVSFGLPIYKHWGYALQWYLFALLVLIYYLIACFKGKDH